MKKLSKTYLLLPVLILLLFSACTEKEQSPIPIQTSNSTAENIATTTEQENIPVWPEPIYTEKDYIGWKTYTNEKLGYKIKYPADWTIDACDEGCTSKEVIINPPDAEMFASYISIRLEDRSIEGIRSVYLNPYYYDGNPDTESEIIFSNILSINFLSNVIPNSRDIIISKNNQFSISVYKDNNKNVLQSLASFEFIAESDDENNKQKYYNPELPLSFSYPKNCSIKTSKENKFLDNGKIKNINVLCGRNIVISFKYISKDYKEGNGEGCCFYYSDNPFDVSLSSFEIKNKLKEFKPTGINTTLIDGVKTIRFISEKSYVNTWKIQETIIPQNKGEYSNLLISSPDINDTENFIIYNNIYKSIKLK